MTLYERISQHAARRPGSSALRSPRGEETYPALLARIDRAMALLERRGASIIALDLENGPDWVAFDIAALDLGLCVAPLPAFFSAAQMRHAITRAGVEAVISDRPRRLRERLGELLGAAEPVGERTDDGIAWLTVRAGARSDATAVPPETRKITFTSGTTGDPKGVLLSWPQMRAVVQSLADAVRLDRHDRHLALLPLPILLENIAGIYAPLWAGASITLLPIADIGMQGAAAVDGAALAAALTSTAATTAIFTPQTLQAVIETIEEGASAPAALRFCAVGGAPVSSRLLARAAAAGLPVFEGYGLSECSSVVCLNTPDARRPGSVGRPLPHVELAVDDDGEIIIRNSDFLGYLAQPSARGATFRTGDLGAIDDAGFLYLTGRRSNVFITAFGRNVAPEWVERELTLEPEIAQAALFGEARPFNVAVIVPAQGTPLQDVDASVQRVNRGLPDYARVSQWIRADAPFTLGNGLLTGNARIRRNGVWARYRDAIESTYQRTVNS
jgi:long-subunit acyl-CoA synthetase (AMP-forming)